MNINNEHIEFILKKFISNTSLTTTDLIDICSSLLKLSNHDLEKHIDGTDVSIAEIALLIAAKSKNRLAIEKICHEITNKKIYINIDNIDKNLEQDLVFWKNKVILTFDAVRAIKSEFIRLNTENSNKIHDVSNIFDCIKKLTKNDLLKNSGISDFNIIEQALYEISKTNISFYFEEIYQNLETKGIIINSEMLKKISLNDADKYDQLELLKNNELVNKNPTEAVKCELKRLQDYTLSQKDFGVICNAITHPNINLNDQCDLENGLTIREQIIRELFINSTSNDQFTFTDQEWENLLKNLGSLLNTKTQLSTNIENWWLKEHITFELLNAQNHLPFNENKVIAILSKDPNIWKNQFHDTNSFIIYQTLYQAYMSRSVKMLEAFFHEISKFNVYFDPESVASHYYPNNFKIQIEKNEFLDWINKNILLISNEISAISVLIHEYLRSMPNPKIINDALKILAIKGYSESEYKEIFNNYFTNAIDYNRFTCWLAKNISDLDLSTINNIKKPTIKDIAIIAELNHDNTCPTGNFRKSMDISNTNFENEKTHLKQTIFNLMEKAESTYKDESGKYLSLSKFADDDLEQLREIISNNMLASSELDELLNSEDNDKLKTHNFTHEQYHELVELLDDVPSLQEKLKMSRDPKNFNSDYITRLTTNEFFFYTSKPLSHQEFEDLQHAIYDKAKKLSSGVHLVLSSFALSTEKDKFVNVTVFITGGEKPVFNFIVKNNTSHVDPQYNITNANNTLNFNASDRLTEPNGNNFKKLKIGDSIANLSYNNLFECQTPSGIPFYTGIDVCLDHSYGVARSNLLKEIQSENLNINDILCSHIVTSNTHSIKKENIIGPNDPMHVDPIYSVNFACKESVTQILNDTINTQNFGSSYAEYHLNTCPIYSFDDIIRLSLSKAICQDNDLVTVSSIKPFQVEILDESYKQFITDYLKENNIEFHFKSNNEVIEIQDEFFQSNISTINSLKITELISKLAFQNAKPEDSNDTQKMFKVF